MSRIKNGIFLLLILFGSIGNCRAHALSLQESVKQALAYSPKISEAVKSLDASQARLLQAASVLVPRVDLSGNYGKSYVEPATATIPGIGSFSLTPNETAVAGSYSLSLSQPVFHGGKIALAYSVARSSYQIVKEELRKAYSDVSYNAAVAYYRVLKAEKMVELVEQQIGNTQKYLEQVTVFYDTGLATKADLLRVKAQLADFKRMDVQYKSALTIARLSFNSIIGRPLNTIVELDELSDGDLATTETDTKGMILAAYDNNPDWLAFLRTKQIAETGVGLAWGGFSPNIDLMGQIGRNTVDYPNSGKTDLGNWRAMLVGNWNIFDGFYNFSKVAEARANADALKAKERDVRDQIELAVTSAVAELQAAAEQITAAAITTSLSSQSMGFAEANYASQIGTNLSVLDAQTLMFQSSSSLWSSKYDYQIAKAKINRVVGKEVFRL